ncbi:hypothetical protein ABT275_36020 [Streptomyces sp. NPDC001185]|uniref:hypothetical protein n=1 Tax=Streptomyces sp. NPDC001185 TaxID=3154380 RepID=UPI00331C9A24
MRGVLRVAPLGGETTWSYLCRLAAGYRIDSGVLLDGWRQANRRPRLRRGRPAAVVDVLFDEAGQELLQELSGIPRSTLAQALQTWQQGPATFAAGGTPRTGPDGGRGRGESWPGGLEAGRVRFQDARTFGSVALACRLWAARRTGHPVRYLPLWSRVCHRHQRWQSDAGPGHAGQPGRLDVAACPEIGHAQRRWPALARQAVGRGHDPRQAFALARTIVLQWWQHAPAWRAERIWPTRVHRLTRSTVGDSPAVWSASVRDAAVLPETIVLAKALTDPACIRLAHTDHSNRLARWGAAGRFVHHLGHRLNRPWLGPLISVDYTSPLHAWINTAAPPPTTPARP